MCEPFRQNLIEKHRFYVEQAQKRLLSQFENIQEEAEKASEEYMERMSENFNPDVNDPSELYESAYEEGFAFYQLLSDMRDNTILSITAGMFHQWDKSLREWIVKEMRHWHSGENARQSIWKVDFHQIIDFLVAVGFDVKKFPSFKTLDALRLVVNVYKHGNGSSFDALKATYPEFLTNPLIDDGLSLDWVDHTFLTISDQKLEEFSDAIMEFWSAVPERIYLSDQLDVPDWFEKAFNKDMKKP